MGDSGNERRYDFRVINLHQLNVGVITGLGLIFIGIAPGALQAIIEGRDSLLKEIADSPIALQKYLAETAEQLLAEPRFLDVLPGFVLDAERVPLIIERLKNIKSQYG